jgi:uncharacterized protein YdaU (DUF1376 family)
VNYYNHHIGDYLIDTAHLSILEDGVYRRLMDRYYTSEQPITADEAALFRIMRARTEDEQTAVRTVLAEFFTSTPDGWRHKRCDAEIEIYKAKAEANRENGTKGGRPRKEPTPNPEITQSVSELEPNNNPNITLTKNQEPITNNQKPVAKVKQRATRLPADWVPSSADIEFCKTERSDLDAHAVAAQFRDYWLAAEKGAKADWAATWRNWVRNQRGAMQARASPHGYESAKDRSRREAAEKLTGRKNDSTIIDITPSPPLLG